MGDPHRHDLLFREQLHEVGSQGRGEGFVEGGERFVDEQQGGVGGHGPRDRDPLPHAARQLSGIQVGGLLEVDAGQPLLGDQIRGVTADHQGDVAVGAVPGQQPGFLEHLRQPPLGPRHRPAVAGTETRDGLQQRGFSRPGGSRHGEGLSGRDHHVEAVD